MSSKANSAGKGSRARNNSSKKFRVNYSRIEWRKTEPAEKRKNNETNR